MVVESEGIREARKFCKFRLAVAFALLVAAVVVVAASTCMHDVMGLSGPDWFQRSGSILTAASAWAYAWNERTYRLLWASDGMCASDSLLPVLDDYKCKVAAVRATSLIFTIIGTLVWGYGDIIAARIFT